MAEGFSVLLRCLFRAFFLTSFDRGGASGGFSGGRFFGCASFFSVRAAFVDADSFAVDLEIDEAALVINVGDF